MSAEVFSTESEESRVHWCLEEEDGDQDTDGTVALSGADDSIQGDGDSTINHKKKVSLEDCGQTCRYESTDSEGDQGVREEVGSLSGSESTVLSGVVDKEGGNGDLSTNIAELSNEAEDHVELLVEWSLADLVSELISSEVLDSGGVEHLLRDFWQLGNEEQDGDGNTGTGNGEVDELDIDQVVGVLAGEEELGCDQGADEGCNTIPRLAELESG